MNRFTKNNQIDCEYYNAHIHNPPTATQAIVATYSENKNNVILDKQNDYYVSVVRFEIPTSAIPIFDFLNNTYSVTIGNSQTFVVYVSSGSLGSQQVAQPVRSVQDFLDMINTALNTSYVADGSKGAAGPPFMIFNNVTSIFSIVVPSAFVAAGGTIYFNDKLFAKFGTFQAIFSGYGTALGKDFQIVVKDNGDGNLQTPYPPTSVNSYVMSQEVADMALMYDIQNIVITTNMAVNSENLSSTASSGASIALPVLTDFAVLQQPTDLLQRLIYNANPYRLINLINDHPLTSFSFQVFWQDKNRVLHELLILPSDYLAIKLGFFRKTSKVW